VERVVDGDDGAQHVLMASWTTSSKTVAQAGATGHARGT
jgi:hypothetical protein